MVPACYLGEKINIIMGHYSSTDTAIGFGQSVYDYITRVLFCLQVLPVLPRNR